MTVVFSFSQKINEWVIANWNVMRNLDKHRAYQASYQSNDTYWGIGLEQETYLETNKLKQVTSRELKENKEPERYSVRYYDVYESSLWEKTMDDLFSPDAKLLLPILINSHTFQKTDLAGEHPHTTDRLLKVNPKFEGKTFHEWAMEQNPDVFRDQYENTFTFDGDAIEFKTQHFYKATVKQALQELNVIKKEWMRALNSLPRDGFLKLYAPFQFAGQNYPFATYLTNLKHNAMFHNGTIHINLTLPTKLNANGHIVDKPLFVRQHQALARAIQWLSPLLVASYGTPDPLCESKQYGSHYAAGSQRVAVSRYTGLGTYDTDTMEEGVVLTKKREQLVDLQWYEAFHRYANYTYFQEIGMDLNFHKYDGHGLEIRFLESMPMEQLEELLTFLPYLADFSLESILTEPLPNPKKSATWQLLAEQCVHLGKGHRIDVSVQQELFRVYQVTHVSKEPLLVEEVLHIIQDDLIKRFQHGRCVSCMIHGTDNVWNSSSSVSVEPTSHKRIEDVELSVVPSYASALSAYGEHLSSESSSSSSSPLSPTSPTVPSPSSYKRSFFNCCV